MDINTLKNNNTLIINKFTCINMPVDNFFDKKRPYFPKKVGQSGTKWEDYSYLCIKIAQRYE